MRPRAATTSGDDAYHAHRSGWHNLCRVDRSNSTPMMHFDGRGGPATPPRPLRFRKSAAVPPRVAEYEDAATAPPVPKRPADIQVFNHVALQRSSTVESACVHVCAVHVASTSAESMLVAATFGDFN